MKKLIIIISITTFCLVGTGCNDWLDILPKNEQVTDDYWKSKEDVEAVLASGYYYMRTSTKSLINWGELRGASIFAYSKKEEQRLQNFQLTPSSDLCKWDAFYQVINMANSVIAYAPTVQTIDATYTEEAMKSHQTEAYFMRSLAYFFLVRNFKEVPLVLNPYIDDSAPYAIAKSSEEEIINQIKSDITTALESGAAKEFFNNENWRGADKGRATKWALYALMADVCLWSEDYDGCIQYADYLINATSSKRPAFMSIPQQWFTMFNPGNSNESIFELNWDHSTFAQTKESPSNYFTVSASSDYQFATLMMERLNEETLQIEQAGRDYVRSLWGAYAIMDSDNSEFGTYCVWKYRGTGVNDISATRINADANYIIYRMADVMLMKAEALIWKGEGFWQNALDIINQIRIRANLDPLDIQLEETSEEDMLGYLLHERDIEFAAEGKRWYDLVRFGKSQNYKYKEQFITIIMENNSSANDSWIRSVLRNEYAWYLPINQSEMETNSLLVQNPYYNVTN